MLIEFAVTNYKSINEEQKLTLVADQKKDLLEANSFDPEIKGCPRLLRSAVIYGANAAGKTNLIKALGFMQGFVINSARKGQKEDRIPVTPFLLNQENKKKPSEFSIIFIHNGARYYYGFSVNKRQVCSEWLWAYPEGHRQRWFERELQEDGKTEWYFGEKFKGQRSSYKEQTRENALFLSTAVQLNNEQLDPVFSWFSHKLEVISGTDEVLPNFTVNQCSDLTQKQKVQEFLNAADLSIADIIIEERDFSSSDLPDKHFFPPEILEQLEGKKFKIPFLVHHGQNESNKMPLPLSEDSAGTQKLFAYAGPLLDTLDKGMTLVIDEFNNSLHPLVIRNIMRMIHHSKANANNAQFIFSTHDVSLLDLDIFRRDQIWFVEKDEAQATSLYPLTDFHPRKGEAVNRGYLNGRYGAIPFIPSGILNGE